MPDITTPSLLMFMISFWNYVALNDTSDTWFSNSRCLTCVRASGFMRQCRYRFWNMYHIPGDRYLISGTCRNFE